MVSRRFSGTPSGVVDVREGTGGLGSAEPAAGTIGALFFSSIALERSVVPFPPWR